MGQVKRVRKAVIPAAGLGTRFLPATKAVPKEMIPIVDVPMIQHIVEEAVKSGIEQVIIIAGRNKGSIEDHFDFQYELDDTLEKRGKTELLKTSRFPAQLCELISIRQKAPLGLGHAVLTAAPIVGDEPFAVLLGDELMDSEVPCTKQLIDLYEQRKSSVVATIRVEKQDVSKYGIVDGKEESPGIIKVSDLVEKPSPDKAPSQNALPGRYVLSPEIFDFLRETKPGAGGEIQLTDGLQKLAKGPGLYAFDYKGDRYDTGDRLGFIDATLAFALRRDSLRDGVRAILKKHLDS